MLSIQFSEDVKVVGRRQAGNRQRWCKRRVGLCYNQVNYMTFFVSRKKRELD